MKRITNRVSISIIMIAALLFAPIYGMDFISASVYADSGMPSLNIDDVTVSVYEDDFDRITFTSDVTGLATDCFTVTDNTTPSLYPMVVDVNYASGTYTLRIDDLNYYDTFTLTVSQDGYAEYTNSDVYYGTLATDEDLDLINELNMYDTYARTYNEDTGVLTISNDEYKANAILYPYPNIYSNLEDTLYYKINTNNGYNTNGAGDYRVIGAFAVAPNDASTTVSAVKVFDPTTKKMKMVEEDSLIDSNPNYQETVASGKAVDNAYWKKIYAYPLYAKNAVKLTDGGWMLYDPADRLRLVQWYDQNGDLIKVIRFTEKVEYKGDKESTAPDGYPSIILGSGGDSMELADADGGLAVDATISSFSGWDGGELAIRRVSTSFADDSCVNDTFDLLENDTFSKDGSNQLIDSNGDAFGKWDESGGKLSVSLYDIANDTLVQAVIQNITYSNDTPYGDAMLQLSLSDDTNTAYAYVLVKNDVIYVDRELYDTGGDAADGFNLAEALAKAENGDEILIEDGTYQGQFLVTTAITLDAADGESGDVTLLSPDTNDLAKSEQDLLTANGCWRMPILELRTVTPGSGIVTVRNITVDGNFQSLADTDSKDMLGIAAFNTNAVIDGVTIKNIASALDENGKYNGFSVDFGILAEGADNLSDRVSVTVKNSTLKTYRKTGIIAWGPMLHVVIQNNTIIGNGDKDSCGQNGMQIGSSGLRTSTTAEISGNTISNLGFDNDFYFSTGIIVRMTDTVEIYDNRFSGTGNDYVDGNGVSCGVSLMQQKTPVNVHDNTVSNMQYGAVVEAYGSTYVGAHTFKDNDFSDTYYAVYDCTGTNDETYDEENSETISVVSESPAINALGYIYYKLCGGNDSFTDTGDAPSLIDAGAGTDTIRAGDGEDTIIGGEGDDTLIGGGGNDVFLYSLTDNGVDTIKDFVKGDIIRVSGAALTADAVTTGEGTSVLANSVQVAVSESTSTLYIDTDGVADAAELQIVLDGVYDVGSFQLSGTDITYEKEGIISPATASFDKKASRQSDILVTMALNSLSSITNGAETLTEGSDYTVLGNQVTVLKSYFAAQDTGTATLTFHFGGTTATLTVTVIKSSSGSSGSKTEKDETAETESETTVEVNGNAQTAGTSATSTNSSGQSVTKVTIDTVKLEKILAEKGDQATVTVPVTNGSDVVTAALTGEMVKSMENRDSTLVVKTDSAEYTLPASEINIDAVSKKFGTDVTLSDIEVSVEISNPSDKTATVVESAAADGNFSIVVPPLDFTISCTYSGKTVKVSSFNAYVERTVAIPDDVDPDKITTGIVVKPDGTTYHVPTKITVIDGNYYAVINSLTNSVYTVVWHPVEFADVASHWAKDAINDMGSRMIVTGVGNNNYNPGSDITRAEFAAIIVRALGLEPGTGDSSFSDVSEENWFNQYTETASSYGLILGYDDGSFRPNDKITREQAMSIITRATKLTGIEVNITDSEISSLLENYNDGLLASSYAKESIAACLKTGIISGKGNDSIAPRDNITRAEVAVIMQRLLVKSQLI